MNSLESALWIWIFHRLEVRYVLVMNQHIRVLPSECHGLLQNIAHEKPFS